MHTARTQIISPTERVQQVQKTHPVRVITVTSGKGGVGKTNVTANLATALSGTGQNVMIMDADLGLGNVDVLLGLYPQKTLESVISGECELQDVIAEGPNNLKIIPSASGIQSMAELPASQHSGLIQSFSNISDDVDVLIVDTAAGKNASQVHRAMEHSVSKGT